MYQNIITEPHKKGTELENKEKEETEFEHSTHGSRTESEEEGEEGSNLFLFEVFGSFHLLSKKIRNLNFRSRLFFSFSSKNNFGFELREEKDV